MFALALMSCKTHRSVSLQVLPTQVRGNLMFLKLEVNGKPGLFLVDTGAGISIVDINQASRFHFNYFDGANHGRLDGIGGSQRLFTTGQLKIAHEGYQMKGLRLYGADIASINLFFEKENMKILGILGADFFKKYRAVIDYDKSEIYLAARSSVSPVRGKLE